MADVSTIIISQDGNDTRVVQTVRKFQSLMHTKLPNVTVKHIQKPHVLLPTTHLQYHETTAFIAQHYKRALDYAFEEHEYVITVEDDFVFSPDFLFYFDQTAHLLEMDPSIWCVSSWNDFGYHHLHTSATQLYRTQFFPGLGWMMRKPVWDELSPHIFTDLWDIWMRYSNVHKWRGIQLMVLIL